MRKYCINPKVWLVLVYVVATLAPAAGASILVQGNGMAQLCAAYPQFLQDVHGNVLLWKDGERMSIDDGRVKDFDTLMDSPDLQDQMSMSYPLGQLSAAPAVNDDPGRARCLPFFKKMYGGSQQEVEAHLVEIPWINGGATRTVQITSVNGVDKQLRAVVAELNNLPSDMKKFVSRTAGTYSWRPILGTERLSAHSFGIAIDIDTANSDYWLWDQRKDGRFTYRNRIPYLVVQIFEKYGFIWGGKWYHYDTMHFEYRPELLQNR